MDRQSEHEEKTGTKAGINKMEDLFTEEENAAEVEDLTATGTRSRKKKKMSARDILLVAIPVVAIVAVAVLALLFVKEKKNQTLMSGAHQVYAGSTVDFGADAAVKQNDDGKTVVVSGGTEHEIPEIPIYSGDGKKFMITTDMVYYDPMKPGFGKADRFSEFRLGSGNAIRVSKDSVDRQIAPGFLYDGKDLYVFLEEVELEFNNTTRTLAPFSYVEVVGADSVQIYDNGTGESEMAELDTAITATHGDGDYVVKMRSDTLVRYDGSRVLLFNQPSLLDSIMQ